MAFTDFQNAPAAQKFVPIKEVRDGVAILNDGSLRAILLASSINFALKSQEEQRAVITQFQNFINTVDFSVQFSVQSRNLDIDPYIEQLQAEYKKEDNNLLQTQIQEYIEFIETFTDDADIMRKAFFVVVPYNRSIIDQSGGIMGSLKSLVGGSDNYNQEQQGKSFEEARSQLQQRVGIVEQGLVRTGVRMTQLETEETIELFYQLLNPGNLKTSVEDSSVES
jgi:type IV secretory pathway VirB4 component